MSVLSFMAKRLRDSGRRKRATVRKRPRHRPALEALDDRLLLSVTEFPIPIIDVLNIRPEGITRGPDGNLWFTESSAGRIGRITPAGVVIQFSAGLTPNSQLAEITAGPDGNLWFTEAGSSRIGRITTAGVITEFSAGITPNSQPSGITRGPDGNLWFTEPGSSRIGRITPAGVVTEFSAGLTPGGQPILITAGPDGNLWFGENASKIGRITPAGVVTEFAAGLGQGSQIRGITTGPDGNLWFTEVNHNLIGRITPAGVITEVANVGTNPLEITTGPDGNLWFTEFGNSRIGRLTTAGAFTEFAAGITTGSSPFGIAVGPDGNIWFAEAGSQSNQIGRLNLAQSPDETTTTLRTSAPTIVVGQTVTLTATVTALGGGVVQNGVVDFYNGNTPVSFALLDANGQATVDLTAGAVGTAALKAVLRSGAFPASTSAVVGVTVNRAATTVALASSANPAVTGQSVTFTATVAAVAPGAGTPTGTVTFQDGTVILGTVAVGADDTARFTTSFVAAGGHVITAVYSGDPNFVGSSQALTEQVNATTTGLQQGGFESPAVGNGFQYRPVGTPWTYTGGAGVTGNGSGFTAGNPSAPEGTQVGFLQGTGSFSQAVTGMAAGTYRLSFSAAQRANFQASRQDFRVLVDGVAVGAFTPSGTGYASLTATFMVAAGSHTITFQGLDSAGGDNTAFIDNVRLTQAPAATLSDAGFEAPAVGNGFQYRPVGTPWTFTGNAGVAGNGSGFTAGNPNAPEGSQVGFLQGTGSFSQAVTGMAAGTYQLTFNAAQRANFQASRQDFRVLVDGVAVGTFTPAGSGYSSLTATFTVAAGSHTITFQGLNSAGGDNTAFIDNVQLTQ